MTSEKKKLMARIKRGEKITGNEAVEAAQLGLGQLQRACNGELALSTTSTGIRTPWRSRQAKTED
jgi:hypothetical protein